MSAPLAEIKIEIDREWAGEGAAGVTHVDIRVTVPLHRWHISPRDYPDHTPAEHRALAVHMAGMLARVGLSLLRELEHERARHGCVGYLDTDHENCCGVHWYGLGAGDDSMPWEDSVEISLRVPTDHVDEWLKRVRVAVAAVVAAS